MLFIQEARPDPMMFLMFSYSQNQI